MLQVRLHHAIYIHPLQLESRTSTAQWVLPSYKSTIPTCQVIPGNLEIHLSWQSVQQPQRRDPGSNYWHTVKAEVEEFWHTVKANYWHSQSLQTPKSEEFWPSVHLRSRACWRQNPQGMVLEEDIQRSPRSPLQVAISPSTDQFRMVPEMGTLKAECHHQNQ